MTSIAKVSDLEWLKLATTTFHCVLVEMLFIQNIVPNKKNTKSVFICPISKCTTLACHQGEECQIYHVVQNESTWILFEYIQNNYFIHLIAFELDFIIQFMSYGKYRF